MTGSAAGTGPTVVKIGGSLDVAASEPLLRELAAWTGPLVIVHGAHAEMDRLATALGHPPRMVTSERGELTRYSDQLTMDHFLMAYCGLVNKRLVEALRRLGADAVGLSAMDGGVAVGRRKPELRIVEGDRRRILRDNHAGTIERIDTSLLHLLLSAGRLPVLTPPAISHEGEAINVDGDRLAAELAIALGAPRLVILMNVPGLLRDPGDPASLVPHLRPEEIEGHLALARGRARVKLLAAQRALEGGVATVILAGGGGERPLAHAQEGGGTWLDAAE
ncbi:MAG: [LysW]-aminoadipate kinase [Candidatus Dormibacteria bacterium]|jgi:acetylglutamate/LysW-gamma-L-alpha-aminoadipate kinase